MPIDLTAPRLFTIVAPICGFFAILAWRIREAQTAVTLKKIVAPPLGMSTGLFMFVVPAFRIPWLWALSAFVIGALFLAYPLLRTSRLVRNDDGTIGIHRSPAFLIVLFALALIRFIARGWIGKYVSLQQTGAIFFLLAFGMIVHWRLSMLREYRSLTMSGSD